jgi:hypothetical protein
MADDYNKLYGDDNVLLVLQENGDLEEVVDVYECYMKAQTLDDIDKCNNAVTDVIEEGVKTVDQLDLNALENQMNDAVIVMECYLNAQNASELAACAELEANLTAQFPFSFQQTFDMDSYTEMMAEAMDL